MRFEEVYKEIKKKNKNARAIVTVAEQSNILGLFGLKAGNFIVVTDKNMNAFMGKEVQGLEVGFDNMINIYL